MADIKRVHIIVKGRVQGVGFRYFVRIKAKILGLKGYVRNCEDGTVEVVAEGDEDNIKKLIEFCKVGPPLATVLDLTYNYSSPTGEFDDFKII